MCTSTCYLLATVYWLLFTESCSTSSTFHLRNSNGFLPILIPALFGLRRCCVGFTLWELMILSI